MMKVKDLIEKLNAIDGERIVVLSMDAEGNQFDTLNIIDDNAIFNLQEKEIALEKLTQGHIDAGYGAEDVCMEVKGIYERAVVFWP